MSQPKRLTLIDGSGFIFRAYYAMPNLTNPQGVPVGAVYGFVNMIQKLLRDAQNNEFEDYIAVIFDAGRYTFRNEIYDQYKANRDEAPEDLRPQFALVREATAALNLPAIQLAGVEADDLIATYTKVAKEQGIDEVIVVSSDKDLMQLVDDKAGIHMFDAMKSRVINEAQVEEKFGVAPYKVKDVLALMGDSSDNVPGVPGIGPKTAAQLIQHFGDLESLLSRAEEEVPQKKRKESLIEYADDARLSYTLVTLKDDCELPMPIADCIEKPQEEEQLRTFLQEMGFKKLEERLGQAASDAVASEAQASELGNDLGAIEGHYSLIDEAFLAQVIAKAEAVGRIAVSVEESGIGLCVESGKAVYFPFSKPAKAEAPIELDLFAAVDASIAEDTEVNTLPEALKALLVNPSILKIGHKLKRDMRVLGEITPTEDVTLISYVLSAGLNVHDFDKLVVQEFDKAIVADGVVLGKGKSKVSWPQAEAEAVMPLLAERADYAMRLWQLYKPQLAQQKLLTVYEKLERPLLPILVDMEEKGVLVDKTYLQNLSTEFKTHIASLEKEIHALAGQEFLIGSPKQLGEVLFDSLGLPGGKKSKKSGQYGTGVEILEELAAQGQIIAEKVVQWRMYEKLRSTYTDALVAQIDPDGRVHTTLQQTVAATGRLSSTDPNLQNIPIRTEEGKRIRKAFIAAEGYNLIAADYSQIELRLLAEMADIEVLKTAFKKGQDIHAATASQMFGVALEDMTPEYRRQAKTINFGIIYGISAHGLAVRLGIDRSAAAKFIEAYFEHYPGIRTYMEAKKLEAQENGYITTLYGRKVHIKGIADKNYMVRAFAERQAINAPLQGTAADIIKRAMIAVYRTYKDSETVRPLLQVHDELLFEIKKDVAETETANIKKIMENAANLSLPLVVEAGIGHDWGEIH
ncbi:MAG: DNA polymerase I [Rickettsiales bacterium]|nr:DNA polymerase I [Rickettsiales bacterium]